MALEMLEFIDSSARLAELFDDPTCVTHLVRVIFARNGFTPIGEADAAPLQDGAARGKVR
jgi:hypothetical protein